jgi:HAD superfamily hydrolase (TIGR01450 family)
VPRTAAADADTIGTMLLLVDLDGVLYRGAHPVPGAAEVFARRAEAGDAIVYVTNNSMHYRADYVARLGTLGAPVEPDRVVTSARATALHLQRDAPQVRRVLVVGASGLERELRDVGLEVVTAAYAATRMGQEGIDGVAAAGNPDAVVCGLDPQLTYLRIAAAADCIRNGARFVATNRDPVFPTERGLRPGAGSVVAAIEATTGVTARSIGKPEPTLFELAAEAAGGSAGDAVVVGDGLATDIRGAHAVGARSVLVMTGVATQAQLDALPEEERPTAVAADADELGRVLDELAAGATPAITADGGAAGT